MYVPAKIRTSCSNIKCFTLKYSKSKWERGVVRKKYFYPISIQFSPDKLPNFYLFWEWFLLFNHDIYGILLRKDYAPVTDKHVGGNPWHNNFEEHVFEKKRKGKEASPTLRGTHRWACCSRGRSRWEIQASSAGSVWFLGLVRPQRNQKTKARGKKVRGSASRDLAVSLNQTRPTTSRSSPWSVALSRPMKFEQIVATVAVISEFPVQSDPMRSLAQSHSTNSTPDPIKSDHEPTDLPPTDVVPWPQPTAFQVRFDTLVRLTVRLLANRRSEAPTG